MAATAISLTASASDRSQGGYRPQPMAIGAFVYESGQPLAIEAARVAAGQHVLVSAYDPSKAADSAGELERLVEGLAERRDGAIAGLTSSAAFDLVSGMAAARAWEVRYSAPAASADLLHWIVSPRHIPR